MRTVMQGYVSSNHTAWILIVCIVLFLPAETLGSVRAKTKKVRSTSTRIVAKATESTLVEVETSAGFAEMVKEKKRILVSEESTALIEFSYAGLVRSMVNARFDGTTFYLPFAEILSLLDVPVSVSDGGAEFIGFYAPLKSEYVINFEKNRGECGDSSVRFTALDHIAVAGDVYVSPTIFSQLFGLHFNAQLSKLTLTLTTEHTLPIQLKAMREKSWSRSSTGIGESSHGMRNISFFPLISDLKRSWFNGGGIGYNIATSMAGSSIGGSYGIRGGFQILGGDATVQTSGSLDALSNNRVLNANWSWRYGFTDNNYLTSVSLSNIPMSTSRPYAQGVSAQLTNKPLQPRFFHATNSLRGSAPKGWRVELKNSGETFEIKTVGADETYEFTVPTFYGVNVYTVVKYGTGGEVEEETFTCATPNFFWQGGKVIYEANVARVFGSNEYVSTGEISLGITDWLTNSTRAEYFTSSVMTKPLVTNTTGLLLHSSFNAQINVTPGLRYGAQLQKYFGNLSVIDARYERYEYDKAFAFLNLNTSLIDQSRISIFLPQIFSLQGFGTRLDLIRDNTYTGETYRAEAAVNASFLGMTLMSTYRNTMQRSNGVISGSNQSVLINLLSSTGSYQGIWGALFGGWMFNSSTSINVQPFSVQSVAANLSKLVYQNIQIGVAGTYQTFSKQLGAGVTLSFNFDSFQLNTQSIFNPGVSPVLNASLTGAVGFDASNNSFSFSRQDWIGTAATAFRPFLDLNNNGSLDDGEQLLKAPIRTSMGGMAETSTSIQKIVNIPAYSRINAQVDPKYLESSAYLPVQKDFSFMVAPNGFNSIDVPFVNSCSVQGFAYKSKDGAKTTLPGLRVFVEGITDSTFKKNSLTFSDGELFMQGLRPGRYKVYPDTMQLRIMQATVSPEVYELELKPIGEGDIADSINFTVQLPKTQAKEVAKEVVKAREYGILLAGATSHVEAEIQSKQLKKYLGIETFVRQYTLSAFGVGTYVFVNPIDANKYLDSLLDRTMYGWYTSLDPDKCSTPAFSYTVTYASFTKREEAERFIADKYSILSGDVRLNFDAVERAYTVVSTRRYATLEEAGTRLKVVAPLAPDAHTSVLSTPECGRSYYCIVYNTFRTYNDALAYGRNLRSSTKIPVVVWFDVAQGLFVVSSKKEFANKVDAEKMLETYKSAFTQLKKSWVMN